MASLAAEGALAMLFAHGAGAPSTSPWMLRWRDRLSALGTVRAFDYPYAAAGRKRPDPHGTLLAAHRKAYEAFRGAKPLVLAGKSMGSRIGCHLAAALETEARDFTPQALICFGYPLVGSGKTKKIRDEVLLSLRHTPILFVQGTRDRLCPLDLLETIRKRMQVRNELHVVEAGDHSLEITKTRMKREDISQASVDTEILEAVRSFLGGQVRLRSAP